MKKDLLSLIVSSLSGEYTSLSFQYNTKNSSITTSLANHTKLEVVELFRDFEFELVKELALLDNKTKEVDDFKTIQKHHIKLIKAEFAGIGCRVAWMKNEKGSVERLIISREDRGVKMMESLNLKSLERWKSCFNECRNGIFLVSGSSSMIDQQIANGSGIYLGADLVIEDLTHTDIAKEDIVKRARTEKIVIGVVAGSAKASCSIAKRALGLNDNDDLNIRNSLYLLAIPSDAALDPEEGNVIDTVFYLDSYFEPSGYEESHLVSGSKDLVEKGLIRKEHRDKYIGLLECSE